MSNIFYLMGKSASGKDTIYKKIKERFPALREVVIYTTRPMRAGEREGVEYHFVTREDLEKMRQEGIVIESRDYHTVHGLWTYFTVDDEQFHAKEDLLAIGTLESYQKMRAYLGEERLVPLYVEVEDGLRLARALERERAQKEPKYKELCRRFLADAEDFSEENLNAAGIVRRYQNENLEDCVEAIAMAIEAQ